MNRLLSHIKARILSGSSSPFYYLRFICRIYLHRTEKQFTYLERLSMLIKIIILDLRAIIICPN